MTIMPKGATHFSSREFNQKTGEAKNAAKSGPVFITDRGEPAYVLLSIEDYATLADKTQPNPQPIPAKRRSLVDALAHPESADIELDIPPRQMARRTVDFD